MPRGRPRSEKSQTAILTATQELIEEVGFEKCSIEAVAKRAGVGKQTIYRWWPSKGALVADAVVAGLVGNEPPAIPDTGNLRQDLWTWLSMYVDTLRDPYTETLVRIITAASAEHRETAESLNAGLAAPLTAAMVARIERARHELAPTTDPMVVAASLVGAPYTQLLAGDPMTATQARSLFDVLMDGALRH